MTDERAASRTAIMVAAHRGRASAAPDPICDDPWALRLAGPEGEALSLRWDQHSPSMVLWMGLRTRYLDDAVRQAIARGFEQVVILGAGLDTRAARLAESGVRFFEVDQPASQVDKRTRLSKFEDYPVDAATFVPCDFERDDFVQLLEHAGLDRERPACFVWEGVIYYLAEAAARSTLERLASEFEPRSVLMFDYLNSRMAKASPRLRDEDRAMKGIIDELGEPMRFGIDDATPLMAECGYRYLRTVSFDELALQYTGTYARERFFRFQAIAVASASEDPGLW
ncbi:MAG: class I SAM-dependent methyltransferase [Myxococcales bacterium]|nr:MAG: class I SAM-dependent methyltransferase [Myxococcales bacterium]